MGMETQGLGLMSDVAAGLAGKTVFISGGSRGIGLAVGLRAARDGANIVIAAKTVDSHPKLAGTIHSAAEEIEAAGGKALPLFLDICDAEGIERAVSQAADHFGGLDICINNASAISLARSEEIELSRFDLLQQINVRGTFLLSRACLPHLRKAENPHILTFSPPLEMRPEWLGAHLPYTLSKFGMSMVAMGLAEECRPDGIAVNALWPRTTIATAAIEFALGGDEMMRRSRKPEIMADAAYAILTKPARSFTGHCVIDDEVLATEGVTDFERYRIDPAVPLQPDIFVDPLTVRANGSRDEEVLNFNAPEPKRVKAPKQGS